LLATYAKLTSSSAAGTLPLALAKIKGTVIYILFGVKLIFIHFL
jgi:hypothetical protein